MTNNELKLAEIETALHGQPPELRSLYTAKLSVDHALAAVAAEGLKGVLWQAENHIFPQLDGEVGGGVLTGHLHRGGCAELGQLAQLDAAANALARHPLMPEATAIFEPLLAERTRLRDAVEAERKALDDARDRAQIALHEAREKAAAAALSDSAVLAAQAELARLENPEPAPPPKLVRGKIPLAAD